MRRTPQLLVVHKQGMQEQKQLYGLGGGQMIEDSLCLFKSSALPRSCQPSPYPSPPHSPSSAPPSLQSSPQKQEPTFGQVDNDGPWIIVKDELKPNVCDALRPTSRSLPTFPSAPLHDALLIRSITAASLRGVLGPGPPIMSLPVSPGVGH